MRFDYKAYEKVFPPQTAPQTVDTAVEGFNPTAAKAAEKAKDDMPGDLDPKPENNGKQDDPAGSGDTPPAGSEEKPPEGV